MQLLFKFHISQIQGYSQKPVSSVGLGWSCCVSNAVIELTQTGDMDGRTKTRKPIHTKPFNSEDEKQQQQKIQRNSS